MVKLINKGFTLVELMVVIVIIGVLAAVAIPKFMAASDKAKASEFPTVLTQISTSQAAFKAETGAFNSSVDSLGNATDSAEIHNSKWFSYTLSGVSSTAFTGTATVKTVFGGLALTDNATINESGTKTATAPLLALVKNWK